MSKDKKTNIEKVFQELQSKGLIDKKSKLIKNSSESNFRNLGKKIYYNPIFANINRDSLRYILLHEEAHNKQFQNSTWIFLTGLILAIPGVCFLKSFLITVISFFIPFVVFKKLIWKDEFNADLWSAERLNKFYKIKHPSKIMKDCIKEYKKIKEKRDLIRKIITYISKIMDLHPPYEERVKFVKKKIR